jgi:hypothetical protein
MFIKIQLRNGLSILFFVESGNIRFNSRLPAGAKQRNEEFKNENAN